MKRFFVFAILFILSIPVFSQELNARVQVVAPNVANLNRRNLEALQTLMKEFLTSNKWTNESYLANERIDCNFIITVTSWDGASNYKAEAQIQSSRPVYGTSYQSTMLSMSDKDFDFTYNQGQTLDFSEQNFISNLNSLLAFYAYTLIGLDKDSFSNLGGSRLFEKANNTLSIAQNSGFKGWKAVDGLRNRYWLIENLTNNSFNELRAFIYHYHLDGLDRLQNNTSEGIKNISNNLSRLQRLDKQKLGSIFPNVYFSAKAEEIVNVFNLGQANDKLLAFQTLSQIDPANIRIYEGLNKN